MRQRIKGEHPTFHRVWMGDGDSCALAIDWLERNSSASAQPARGAVAPSSKVLKQVSLHHFVAKIRVLMS